MWGGKHGSLGIERARPRPGEALTKRPSLLKYTGAGVWTGVRQEEAAAGPSPVSFLPDVSDT